MTSIHPVPDRTTMIDMELPGRVAAGRPHPWGPTASTADGSRMVHAILNAYEEPLDFELPPVAGPGLPRRRIVDTGLDAPDDICGLATASAVRSDSYRAEAPLVLLSADLRERGEATAAPGTAATAVAALR